mmetsp:Transcript_54710/g.159591  ORF Transcript_54710/g.159591 Transcript_54710/m.159591 type:complete len:313 (+) Transcript_54710:59-997(+)
MSSELFDAADGLQGRDCEAHPNNACDYDRVRAFLQEQIKKIEANKMEANNMNTHETTANKMEISLAETDFYNSKDNTFFYDVMGWETTTVSKVNKLLAVTPSLREAFVPVSDWEEVGAVSLHKAVATKMLDTLRKAKRIIDLGCGTGALLAIFAELAPRAKLEGIEGMEQLVEAAPSRLIRAAEIFERAGKPEAGQAMRVAAVDRIAHGDAFGFNADGSCNGLYNVVTVGFAMINEDVPIAFWNALADGGQLCVAICDEPLQVAYGKYQAYIHFFTKKKGESKFPGSRAPLGRRHEKIDIPVHFELVRPMRQ